MRVLARGGAARGRRTACLALAGLAALLGPVAWRLAPRARREFLETSDAFEQAVHELLGTDLLVDGYKHLAHVAALATGAPRDRPIRLLHMVRDPRGYTGSRRRYAQRPIAAGAREWARKQRMILALARVLRAPVTCASATRTCARIRRTR